MTIKQAIKVLEDGRWYDYYNYYGPDLDDADKAKDELLDAIEIAVANFRAQQEAEKNEPLTWDELCQMAGQPVFVKDLYSELYDDSDGCFWAIVSYCGENFESIGLAHESDVGDYGDKERYGKSWIAYRRPLDRPA